MPEAKQTQWRIFRWGKRILKWMFYGALAYAAIILIGLFPVNSDFVPAEDGIKIYLVSNDVHADIIVPVGTESKDWSEDFGDNLFAGDGSGETHIAFGWGDKGFFLETETWEDFKLSVAANALLLPSESCMHVTMTRPEYYSNAASVTISHEQYQRLIDHIDQSFEKSHQGTIVQIPDRAYSKTDAFFEARGRYHLLNTCNSWVGRGLKNAGVKVPWFSPLPRTPMLYF